MLIRGPKKKLWIPATPFVVSAGSSFVLDQLSVSAVGAWSTRKLRTAYAGSAIQVRRSSDSTVQDIGFDGSGNLDTTALATFVGANNGFISKVYDQSGSAHDLLQATAANQFTIVSAGVNVTQNSKTCWQSGSSTLWLAATFTLAQTYTINQVLNFAAWVNNAQSWGGVTANAGAIFNASGTLSLYSGSVANTTSTTLTGGMVLTAAFSGASSVAFQNGTSIGTVSPGTTNPGGVTFGNSSAQNSGPSGIFCEGFAFATPALSTADRHILERNQGTYWGITVA